MSLENTNKIDSQDYQDTLDLRERYSRIVGEIGQVEVEIRMMRSRLSKAEEYRAKLDEEYDKASKAEEDLVQRLSEKYGDGVFNLADGTFVKSSDPKDTN